MTDNPALFLRRIARAASGPLAVFGVLLFFRGAMLLGSVPSGIDNTFFHLPFYSLRSFQFFPLWNPFEFCGLPTMGNPQFGSFYPPAFLFAWPDAPAAYRLFIFAHYYWAGLGMWLVARRWRLGWSASLLTAAVFMCGGYMFGRMSNPVVFLGCAWMPWVLWAAHRAWSSRRAADAALAGVVFALMAHAGSPHGMVYGAILTALFLAAAALAPRWTVGEERKNEEQATGVNNEARETRALRMLRGAALLALGAAVYLGLHAPALLPTLEHLKVSVREAATFADLTRDSLPWAWAPALILGGNRLPEYTDATAYIGLMPWLAVLLAAALGRAERRWAFPLLLMAAGLGLALGRHFIFYRVLAALPGGRELIGPMRALILWALGASLLAGMAFDRLRGLERPRLFFILAGALLAGAAGALAWVLPQIQTRYWAITFLQSRTTPPDLFIGLNLALGLLLMALWLAVAAWKPHRFAWREGLFLIFLIGDLMHFAPRVFIFFCDASYFSPPPVLAAVAPTAESPFSPRAIGFTPTQIYNESEDDARPVLYMHPKLNNLYRMPLAEGFDPVFIRRYGELVNALGLREPLDDPFRTVRFTAARHPFFNFAHVGWVIGDPWERAVARRRILAKPEGVDISLRGEGPWVEVARLAAARQAESALPLSPATDDSPTSPPLPRVAAVRLLHFTARAVHFQQGWVVGRVLLWRGEELVAEFPVRLGEEVADYLAATPGAGAQHVVPQSPAAWPAIEFTIYHADETQTAATTLATFRLPAPVEADRLTLVRRPQSPQPFEWIVEAVSVVDEAADDGFEQVSDDPVSPVWRNRRVQPFAWAAGAVERAASDEAGLARLGEFTARDWARRVVLAPLDADGGAPLPDDLWMVVNKTDDTSKGKISDDASEGNLTDVASKGSGAAPRVSVEWVSTSELILKTESAQPFLVALSQLWHPGWRATSDDGAELALHRVNYAFQGVVAPAGRHTIRLHFWPHGLTPGLIAAAAALVMLVIIFAMDLMRKSK